MVTVQTLEIAFHTCQFVLRSVGRVADDGIVLHGFRLRGPLEAEVYGILRTKRKLAAESGVEGNLYLANPLGLRPFEFDPRGIAIRYRRGPLMHFDGIAALIGNV